MFSRISERERERTNVKGVRRRLDCYQAKVARNISSKNETRSLFFSLALAFHSRSCACFYHSLSFQISKRNQTTNANKTNNKKQKQRIIRQQKKIKLIRKKEENSESMCTKKKQDQY